MKKILSILFLIMLFGIIFGCAVGGNFQTGSEEKSVSETVQNSDGFLEDNGAESADVSDQMGMPYNITLGDVNRDGLTEMIQYHDNVVKVYKVNPDKTLLFEFKLSLNIKRLFVGDFYNQDYDQVMIITTDNTLNYYVINGDKTNMYRYTYSPPFITSSDEVYAGDFNNNGFDELLKYNKTTGEMKFYSTSWFLFQSAPDIELGDLPVNKPVSQLRVGDFNGDGRDDILRVNSAGVVGYYRSVLTGTKTSFDAIFYSGTNQVKANEIVSIARIDDNISDDIVVRNELTGETDFYSCKLHTNGFLTPINITTGQIKIIPNSSIYWGVFKTANETGGTTRHDSLVFDNKNKMFTRADARWSTSENKLTYWHYYTKDITIPHFPDNGYIRDKWISLGAEDSVLGMPKENQGSTPDGVGIYQHFEKGSIYKKDGKSAYAVYGDFYKKWSGMGWEKSNLGYPKEDRKNNGTGDYQGFEKGSIHKKTGGKAFAITGDIYKKWASIGWENGQLRYPGSMGWVCYNIGYPISDECTTPNNKGIYQHFENGSIYQKYLNNACVISGSIRDKWESMGWENSILGFPLEDQINPTNGFGIHQGFETGGIYQSVAYNACAVSGEIYKRWMNIGFENSSWGYPTSDEYTNPDNRGTRQEFQGGAVYHCKTPGNYVSLIKGYVYIYWANLGWENSHLGYPISDITQVNTNWYQQLFEHKIVNYWRLSGLIEEENYPTRPPQPQPTQPPTPVTPTNLPDLTVTVVSHDGYYAHIRVSNIGSVDINHGNFSLLIRGSAQLIDNIISMNDYIPGGILAGTSIDLPYAFIGYSPAGGESYPSSSIKVMIDYYNNINESNETNNSY